MHVTKSMMRKYQWNLSFPHNIRTSHTYTNNLYSSPRIILYVVCHWNHGIRGGSVLGGLDILSRQQWRGYSFQYLCLDSQSSFQVKYTRSWVKESPKQDLNTKLLVGSAIVRSMKESEVHVGASEDVVEKEGFGESLKDLPKALYLMLRNMPYLFATFAGCSDAFIVTSFTVFLPKFLQTQFNLTTSEAGIYTGTQTESATADNASLL